MLLLLLFKGTKVKCNHWLYLFEKIFGYICVLKEVQDVLSQLHNKATVGMCCILLLLWEYIPANMIFHFLIC